MSDTETSTISSEDSSCDVQEQLERFTDVIDAVAQEIAALEAQLEALRRPIESLELAQLGDVPFLVTSPFRNAAFRVKPPGFPGLDLDKRYPFHTICDMLRNYVFQIGAVKDDGSVVLPSHLQQLFGAQEHTTYLELLTMLRNVLI
jgi:hypothetical protein